MKATPSGSWVRIETGISPSLIAELFRQWSEFTDEGHTTLADMVLGQLHDALNPRLTVGQARAFGRETVNTATTAARGAWNEEGVAG